MEAGKVWEVGAIGFAAVGLLTLAYTVYPAVAIAPEPGTFGSWTILSCSVLGELELLASAFLAGLWARAEGKAAKEAGATKKDKGE